VLQINLPNLFHSDTVCASIAFLLQEMTMYTTYDSYFVDHQPLLTKFIEFVCVPTLIKIITNCYKGFNHSRIRRKIISEMSNSL
jgi:hypothetical protein